MANIREISLVDLLPSNLAQDPKVKAAAEALDAELQAVTQAVDQCLIISRIDELSEEVLDLLAWEFHVDFYEPDLPIEQKRELIKNSIKFHKKKGTPAAVEDLVTAIFGDGQVQEWFEYGGDPYKFKVEIEATNRGASEKELQMVERLVEETKNARSWLEAISIYLTSRGNISHGCTAVAGESVTVYPWFTTEIEGYGSIKYACGYQAVETLTIYPKEAS